MSPTIRSYLISFVVGLLLAGLTAGLDYWSNNQTLDWKPFAVAVAGGVVLFLRDWLKNNAGAFLEGVTPAQIKSGVAQGGSSVLVPPPAQKPLDTLTYKDPPPAD